MNTPAAPASPINRGGTLSIDPDRSQLLDPQHQSTSDRFLKIGAPFGVHPSECLHRKPAPFSGPLYRAFLHCTAKPIFPPPPLPVHFSTTILSPIAFSTRFVATPPRLSPPPKCRLHLRKYLQRPTPTALRTANRPSPFQPSTKLRQIK